jgi:hypothetical protein
MLVPSCFELGQGPEFARRSRCRGLLGRKEPAVAIPVLARSSASDVPAAAGGAHSTHT